MFTKCSVEAFNTLAINIYVSVDLSGPPVITSFTVTKDVETSDLVISCLGTGLPEPLISYMGGLEELTNENPLPGHMITDGVIVINAGSALFNYTCIAANKHGTDTKALSGV